MLPALRALLGLQADPGAAVATLRVLERGGGLSADAAAEISQALDLPAPAATPAPAAVAAPAVKKVAVDPNVATVKEFAGAPDL